MPLAQPQAEHLWLQQLIGDWTFESEAVMGPGQPPMKSSGAETVRSIGGLWFIGEGLGEMPGGGGPDTMILTVGYDPDQNRYVGSWIGSMMTHMWIYNGTREGEKLHLDSEGPSMDGDGSTRRYRDTIEFLTADHRTLTSAGLGKDGAWVTFMTVHYRRKK